MRIEIDVEQYAILAQKYPTVVDASGNRYVVVDGILCLEVVTAKNQHDGKEIVG